MIITLKNGSSDEESKLAAKKKRKICHRPSNSKR